MKYDLKDASQKAIFEGRVTGLIFKGALVELKEERKQRTTSQNSAIHLYCEQIASYFNAIGKEFIFKGLNGLKIEIQYTKELVKETIWKPIQIAMFENTKTSELTTKEVVIISEKIEKWFANQGVDMPFPSKKAKIEREQEINELKKTLL